MLSLGSREETGCKACYWWLKKIIAVRNSICKAGRFGWIRIKVRSHDEETYGLRNVDRSGIKDGKAP